MSSYLEQNDLKYKHDMSRFLKGSLYILSLMLMIFFTFIVLGCFKISSYAFSTYESVDSLPYNKVGLLLGTSPLDKNGNPNEFFTNRIMAASQLFKAHKIDYILVSGDNRHQSYNEPRYMNKALVKAGVPQDRIIFDFAGIRTLDSVVRARKVFMQNKITIISQGFHNERALFIADHNDIEAVGFNAINPNENWYFSFVSIREFFARIKAILDVYILNSQPKFLGEPLSIGVSVLPKELSNKPKRLTSPLKQLTDSAYIEKTLKKIEAYSAISKQLTDNAQTLSQNQELPNHYKDEGSDLSKDEDQQKLLLEEQNEALQEAQKNAKESLNDSLGNNVYIDPNAPKKEELIVDDKLKSKPSPRRTRRTDIKNFYGDPWEYN